MTFQEMKVFSTHEYIELLSKARLAISELHEQGPALVARITQKDFPKDDFDDYVPVLFSLLMDDVAEHAAAYLYPKDQETFWISPSMLSSVTYYGEVILRVLRSMTGLNEATMFLRHLMEQVDGCLRKAAYVQESGKFMPSVADSVSALAKNLSNQLQQSQQARVRRITTDARAAATEARDLAASASTAAGQTGEFVLSKAYSDLAKTEMARADKFRTASIFLIGGAVASTGVFVFGPSLGLDLLVISETAYAQVIQRGLFAAALVGLAGYLSRQAQHHRTTANWAQALAVQLMTFSAFQGPMADERIKDNMRVEFAARVFGDHPAMKGEPTSDSSNAAMDTAVAWAAKLMPGGSK